MTAITCTYCARPSPWEGRLPPNWTARHICQSFDSTWMLTNGFTGRVSHVKIDRNFPIAIHLRHAWAWYRFPQAISLLEMPPAAFRDLPV